MPLKFNTYSISAITQAVQDVPKNQRDSIETYLLMNIDRSVPGNQALNTLLSSHFPGADLMINDSSQRAARRDLSDIAWQTMLLQVAADAAIDRPEGVARHIGILFRPEASLENQMFNGDLRLAIAEKDYHMLTEMYNDHISNLEPYDTADFQDLTDEELVGKFSQLYALYNVAQDAAQLLNPTKSNDLGANLSDESKDRLQKLANDMPLFAALMSRFEMICHPYYEKVDTGKLAQEDAITVKTRDLAKDSTDAQFFAQAQQQADRTFDLQFARQLQRNQIDLSSVKICDLEQKEYTFNTPSDISCGEAFRQGKPLVCRDAKGHTIAFRPENNKLIETNARVLVDNAAHASMTTQVNALVELATGSVTNPFWMLTGSNQYKDLKKETARQAQERLRSKMDICRMMQYHRVPNH